MARYIKVNDDGKIIAVRYGHEIAIGEIESEIGELGQIMQSDGTFIDPLLEPEECYITIDEQMYAEILYQTALLELQMLGGM